MVMLVGRATATQMSELFHHTHPLTPTPSVIKKNHNHYNAELETVDFKGGSEAARLKINSWVQKQTQDKIKDLLAEGDVDSLSRLVLVNAIYFKSNWNEKFQQHDTQDAHFRLNQIEPSSEDMHPTAIVPFLHTRKAKLQDMRDNVEWSSGAALQMESLLHGVSPVIRAWMPLTGRLSVGLVLHLIFKEQQLKPECLLYVPAEWLGLSKVVHKAFVEVNDKGTEAAAVTAAVMMLESCAISSPSATFIADHPFLFFIRHNPSMSVLFAGDTRSLSVS
ncbi:serpin B6-like [Etheostoma spectabile]|uniref:serpin B6-like n=1 Tax=Etheostoma spectabile TaxID=54343 RepID=UPI0013AF1E3B|nr:serpin B6-like [Etheostoma spectabile]